MSADIDLTVYCSCYSNNHQLRFTYFKDLKDPANEVCCSIFLSPLPWYKRVWYALGYVFGYKSKFGHWEEILINEEAAEKIKKLLTSYVSDMKVFKVNKK